MVSIQQEELGLSVFTTMTYEIICKKVSKEISARKCRYGSVRALPRMRICSFCPVCGERLIETANLKKRKEKKNWIRTKIYSGWVKEGRGQDSMGWTA